MVDAHHIDRVNDVVHNSLDRRALRVNRRRQRHDPEDPIGRRKVAQLVVVQVAWCVVDRSAGGVAYEYRMPGGGLEHVRVRALGCVCKVDHGSERAKPLHEAPAQP